MTEEQKKTWRSRLILIFGCILLAIIAVWFYRQGWFKDPAPLQHLLSKAGPLGPVLFILLQAFQVIVPILPGGVSGTLGMLCFGVGPGFIYSYVGVILGSAISFLLVRRYGKKLLLKLISEKTYEKYTSWLHNKRKFTTMFAIGIFVPVAPDDALCMIAGLSDISFWKFLLILIVGKPLSMFFYSYGLKWLLSLIPSP